MIMWFGELLTEKGVGNGMSLLIFTSIAARMPAEGGNILHTRGGFVFFLVCVLALADHPRWSTSSRPNAGSRCSTPNAWSAAGCTAGPRPICR